MSASRITLDFPSSGLRSKIQVFSTRSGPTHCFYAIRSTAATTGPGMARLAVGHVLGNISGVIQGTGASLRYTQAVAAVVVL
eukprot:scaffold4829_cov143-Isochrysis_galbana.AAC.1